MEPANFNTIESLRQKPLLTAKDLQAILGICRTATYNFLHNDPPFRVIYINGSIRIPSKDVFRWIDGSSED